MSLAETETLESSGSCKQPLRAWQSVRLIHFAPRPNVIRRFCHFTVQPATIVFSSRKHAVSVATAIWIDLYWCQHLSMVTSGSLATDRQYWRAF